MCIMAVSVIYKARDRTCHNLLCFIDPLSIALPPKEMHSEQILTIQQRDNIYIGKLKVLDLKSELISISNSVRHVAIYTKEL